MFFFFTLNCFVTAMTSAQHNSTQCCLFPPLNTFFLWQSWHHVPGFSNHFSYSSLSSVLDGGVWQNLVVHSFIHCEVFPWHCYVSGFIRSLAGAALQIDDETPALEQLTLWSWALPQPLSTHLLGNLTHFLSVPTCCCLIPMRDFTLTYLIK